MKAVFCCLFILALVYSQTCSLPGSVNVKFQKYQVDSETFTVYNSDNTAVVTYTSDTSYETTKCLPVGLYTVKMMHSSGHKWADGSMLTIEAELDNQWFKIAKLRLNKETEDTVSFSLVFPLLPLAHSTVKYFKATSIPVGWTGSSFTDSTWTTLQDNSRPTSDQKINLFRTSFTVASKAGYHGLEIMIRARWGVIVYLNENEIYRAHVSSGALSMSTTNVGGKGYHYYRSIVVPMSSVNEGSNTLAFALINQNSNEVLSDNIFAHLLASTTIAPRYWDSSSNYGNLFKQEDRQRIYEVKTDSPFEIKLTLNNDRAEAFNKYCLVSNFDAPRHDPRDWTVSGSNDDSSYTTLDSQDHVYFDERSTAYCFYITSPVAAYTYYKLTLTQARSEEPNNHYALSQFNLYLEDLSQATVPEFSIDPAEQVGYTDAAFPKATPSSMYYHKYTISPALPEGLILSPIDGSISGVLTAPVAAKTYTLTALNHLGESKTTTISVAVEVCANDKSAFTLEFVFDQDGDKCSFDLTDLNSGEVVLSRNKLVSWTTITIPMCRPNSIYSVTLKKSDNYGWGSNYFRVLLPDGSQLLRESLAYGVKSKEYKFNPSFVITPKWSEWHYLVDGTAPADDWMVLDGASNNWEKAYLSEIPETTGNAQYYTTKFNGGNVTNYAALDIAVNVRAGAIIYLNGEEIRRVNMPTEGDIDHTTLANNQYTEIKTILTGELVQKERVVEGENILAIELHNYEPDKQVNVFDSYAIFIIDNMYLITDGVGTSNKPKTDNEGHAKIFDNNSDTKYLVGGCTGVAMDWTYNDDRRVIATNFGVVSANDCNARHPSGYKVYGSNDGSNWDLLATKTDVFFTDYHQQKRYDFWNETPYNKYRVETTECKNENLEPNSWCTNKDFQLAEIYLFAKRLDAACKADNGFHAALNGDVVEAKCPEGYVGSKYRACNDGTWGDEINNCKPAKPKSITYPQKEYSFPAKKAIEPIVPVIVGLEVTVTFFPSLPDGLTMDAATGVISGTPTKEVELKKYTINCKNASGSVSTSFAMTITKPEINWVLISILIVLAIIIIVAVVVVVIITSKKKNTKTLPKNAKGGKPAVKAPAAAAVAPKAAIKV